MVGEFPELQGTSSAAISPRRRASRRLSRTPFAIITSPAGQGDEVPTAPATVAVASADQLDSFGRLLRDRRETDGLEGSVCAAPRRARRHRDADREWPAPAHYRRRAGWNDFFDPARNGPAGPRASSSIDFFADRLKVQQREAGVRHDLIDAVFALGGEDDLVRLLARVKALQAFVETAEGPTCSPATSAPRTFSRRRSGRSGVNRGRTATIR